MRLAAIAWRGLRARPLRTALTVAGVALGVAVVAGTLIATNASDAAVRSAVAELLGRADVRVRAFADAGFTPRTVQALRAMPGVLAGAPVSERRLTVAAEPDRVFQLLVLGVDPAAEPAIRDPNLVSGVGLAADSPTDAVVPASWAAANGIGLGDRLLLSGDLPEAPALRVVGLIGDTGFGALERGAVLVMGRDALDAAFGVPAPIRYVDLDVAEGRMAEVEAGIEAGLREPFVLETEADASAGLGAAQAAFATVALPFGLVALVVGGFLVGNTLAMTVSERTREIGLLRAAGATTRQVRGLFLRQGLALGVLGSAVGLVLGVGVAAAMIGFLRSTRAVLVEGLPLDAISLAVAGALGVGVTLIGAALPALRAASVSPLEALRPSRQPGRSLAGQLRWLVVAELVIVAVGLLLLPGGERTAPIVPLLLGLGLLLGGAVATAFLLEPLGRVVGRPFEWFFGAQGLLGRANLSRDRSRTGLTVGALMIALAAIVALGAVAESARAGAERWVASILPGGNAIRLGTAVDTDAFRPTFDATVGLAVATPVVELPAVMREEGDAQREVSLAAIDPNVFLDAGALDVSGADRTDALAALGGGGAVLVPDALARRSGIEPGQVLEIGLPGADPHPFLVAGVLDFTLPARTPDGALLISLADARDLFGATSAALWAMVPQAGIAPSTFRAAVRDTAASLAGQALTAPELADELSRGLDRLVGLFDALALVAVVIGALGIVNTLSVGVSERVREIAILRSNGMTVGQVQAMVVTEAAIMGAIGALLAIAVGLAVAWAMVTGGGAGGFGGALELPWSLLMAVLLGGTGVAALAGLYPARVAGGLPIVTHLKRFE
jgi:putative ABC transport system permease protein